MCIRDRSYVAFEKGYMFQLHESASRRNMAWIQPKIVFFLNENFETWSISKVIYSSGCVQSPAVEAKRRNGRGLVIWPQYFSG